MTEVMRSSQNGLSEVWRACKYRFPVVWVETYSPCYLEGCAMTLLMVVLAVWLCASCVLASVASASKMSFIAWLFVGLVSPLLVVFLTGEYLVVSWPGRRRHDSALSEG